MSYQYILCQGEITWERKNVLPLKKDLTARLKLTILSPFTYHYVVPILSVFLSFAEYSEDILKNIFWLDYPVQSKRVALDILYYTTRTYT